MVHPSFVNRNRDVWEPKFEMAMAQIAGLLSGVQVKIKKVAGRKKLGKGIHRYKIPDHFYTDDYRW